MNLLYFDCFAGIAGDMALAALIDLGADPERIAQELRKLPIDPFRLDTERVVRQGISARLLRLEIGEAEAPREAGAHDGHGHDHVHQHRDHAHDHAHLHEHHAHTHEHDHAHEHGHTHDHAHAGSGGHSHHEPHEHHEHHEHRHAAGIIAMIEGSDLPARAKERSAAIFRLIAEAEGRIHGISPEQVHFHEVGAMDSILDIIGVCLALEQLDADMLMASPVPVGHGRIRIAHGVYPVPAPAVAELLKDVPLSAFSAEGEMTTPTGAGILKALAGGFGPLPGGTIRKIGYGAGKKNFAHPNVVRAILLETDGPPESFRSSVPFAGARQERVLVLEAQLDDMTGEAAGYAMERLFEAGALDVYLTPVYMKKNRPGTLVTALAHPEAAGRCEAALLRETTTLGVRRSVWDRTALRRDVVAVDTPYGTVRVKRALDGETAVRVAPEYEDAAAAARAAGVPLHAVMNAAIGRLQG